jgi:hypothetical protein
MVQQSQPQQSPSATPGPAANSPAIEHSVGKPPMSSSGSSASPTTPNPVLTPSTASAVTRRRPSDGNGEAIISSDEERGPLSTAHEVRPPPSAFAGRRDSWIHHAPPAADGRKNSFAVPLSPKNTAYPPLVRAATDAAAGNATSGGASAAAAAALTRQHSTTTAGDSNDLRWHESIWATDNEPPSARKADTFPSPTSALAVPGDAATTSGTTAAPFMTSIAPKQSLPPPQLAPRTSHFPLDIPLPPLKSFRSFSVGGPGGQGSQLKSQVLSTAAGANHALASRTSNSSLGRRASRSALLPPDAETLQRVHEQDEAETTELDRREMPQYPRSNTLEAVSPMLGGRASDASLYRTAQQQHRLSFADGTASRQQRSWLSNGVPESTSSRGGAGTTPHYYLPSGAGVDGSTEADVHHDADIEDDDNDEAVVEGVGSTIFPPRNVSALRRASEFALPSVAQRGSFVAAWNSATGTRNLLAEEPRPGGEHEHDGGFYYSGGGGQHNGTFNPTLADIEGPSRRHSVANMPSLPSAFAYPEPSVTPSALSAMDAGQRRDGGGGGNGGGGLLLEQQQLPQHQHQQHQQHQQLGGTGADGPYGQNSVAHHLPPTQPSAARFNQPPEIKHAPDASLQLLTDYQPPEVRALRPRNLVYTSHLYRNPEAEPFAWPHYVVTFKCMRPEIFVLAENSQYQPKLGDTVIVDGDRGIDLGTVYDTGSTYWEAKALKNKFMGEHLLWLVMYSTSAASAGSDGPSSALGGGPAPKPPAEEKIRDIRREATPDEKAKLRQKEALEAKAKRLCGQKAREHDLGMEILEAEYQADYMKLSFYYYAHSYINFNGLVNDLFKTYKTRIWMSAVNAESFANPTLGIQAPSGVGIGAVGQAGRGQGRVQQQPLHVSQQLPAQQMQLQRHQAQGSSHAQPTQPPQPQPQQRATPRVPPQPAAFGAPTRQVQQSFAQQGVAQHHYQQGVVQQHHPRQVMALPPPPPPAYPTPAYGGHDTVHQYVNNQAYGMVPPPYANPASHSSMRSPVGPSLGAHYGHGFGNGAGGVGPGENVGSGFIIPSGPYMSAYPYMGSSPAPGESAYSQYLTTAYNAGGGNMVAGGAGQFVGGYPMTGYGGSYATGHKHRASPKEAAENAAAAAATADAAFGEHPDASLASLVPAPPAQTSYPTASPTMRGGAGGMNNGRGGGGGRGGRGRGITSPSPGSGPGQWRDPLN